MAVLSFEARRAFGRSGPGYLHPVKSSELHVGLRTEQNCEGSRLWVDVCPVMIRNVDYNHPGENILQIKSGCRLRQLSPNLLTKRVFIALLFLFYSTSVEWLDY